MSFDLKKLDEKRPDEVIQLRRRLMYARWLYQKACQSAAHYDELNHMLAMMLFHNAIELVLQNVTVFWEFAKPGQMKTFTFACVLDTVERGTESPAPRRAEIQRLAEMRNEIMHHGKRYNRTEVESTRVTCYEFMTEALSKYFSLSFDSMSMIDLIEQTEVRQLLKEANRLSDCGDFGRSTALCAMAIDLLEWALWRNYASRTSSPFHSSISLNSFGFQDGPQDSRLPDVVKQISDKFKEIDDQNNLQQRRLLLLCLGENNDAARQYFGLGFSVLWTLPGMDGKRACHVYQDGPAPTEETAFRTFNFAVDTTIALQSLGLGDQMLPIQLGFESRGARGHYEFTWPLDTSVDAHK